MTEEQKQMIVRLRNVGIGYRKIAAVLDIPRDKVRNYCKSVNLDGYAKRLVERKDREQMRNECPEISCKQCGKPLKAETAGRKRVYCSEKCRKQWAREHPTLYKHECIFCGKEFESRNKQQNFCSHDCYIRNRFWRQEDAEEIFNMLLSGKKVQKVPKWMKDLLSD